MDITGTKLDYPYKTVNESFASPDCHENRTPVIPGNAHSSGNFGPQDLGDPGKEKIQCSGQSGPYGCNTIKEASIIIPVYNQLEYTKQCLEAVWENTKDIDYEIIIANDCSTDDTKKYLDSLGDKITAIHNTENKGFILNCNYAASFAKGKYLVFLNNDTIPQENWLDALIEPVELYSDVAITGAMMIWPDGKILEAGSIVFSDASGWNFGRGDKPNSSRYNHTRESDYVSGGGMLVRKKVWDELGGFDTRYCPAYYDDIDLCFAARKAGYRVLYTPFSRIIHFEGVTGGKDVTQGVKKYQLINQNKFAEKWKTELKKQYPNDYSNVFRASWRGEGKRILWIDHLMPLPNFNSGCLRMNNLMKSMVRLGHKITYVVLNGTDPGDYNIEMRKLGVEVVELNYESWQNKEKDQKDAIVNFILDSLTVHSSNYDFVYFSFYWVAIDFIDEIRKRLPKIIFYVDSHDIHYLRLKREAELYNDFDSIRRAGQTKIDELSIYNKADAVMTVTEQDMEVLHEELPFKTVFLMPNVHDVVPCKNTFAERKDLIFVGGFNHTPNVDAMLFFCKDVFPKIEQHIPGIKLWIVGSNPTEEIKALAKDSIVVTGWVNETKPYLESCRISIAPLRYGAGMKGKIGEAMAHGLPVITSQIGSEGMGIENGKHAIIADSVEEWISEIARLYYDEHLWNTLSYNGIRLMIDNYSSIAMLERARKILSFKLREDVWAQAPKKRGKKQIKHAGKVSIVILTYNQLDYTKECIASIQRYTNTDHEIIIVDNASEDGTVEYIKTLHSVKLIENKQNLGFPAGCNQGIKIATGNYVLLLNNDVVVTKGWLERFLAVAQSDPAIGLVGPVSNMVSGFQLDKNAKYRNIYEMHNYAKKNGQSHRGQIQVSPRLAFLCVLIKAELIDKIGGLDERFTPGNYEDDDFCLRAQLIGYKPVIVKDVFIHHYGSKSFLAEGKNKYLERLKINETIFIHKWGATPDAIWMKGAQISVKDCKFPLDLNPFVEKYTRARLNIGSAEFNQAIENLTAAIELYDIFPENARVAELEHIYYLAGCVSLKLKDSSKAKDFFNKQLTQRPGAVLAYEGLAEALLLVFDYENAKNMYTEVLKLDPANQKAISEIKKISRIVELHDYHSVYDIKEINKKWNIDNFIKNINGDEMSAFKKYFINAYELYELQQYRETIVKLFEAEHLYVPNADSNLDLTLIDLNILRGSCYLMLDDLENAKLSFEKALNLNPASSEACSGLGEIFYRKGQLSDAKTMCEWAVKNDPNSAAANKRLCRVNRELGFSDAHNILFPVAQINEHAINTSPVNESKQKSEIEALIDEAYELFEKKQYSQSLSKLLYIEDVLLESEFIEQNNNSISVVSNFKGFNYLALNKIDKARLSFEEALKVNPQSSQACAGLGEILFLSQKDKESKIMFEWAVKHDPNNHFAVLGLAKVNKTLNLPEMDNSLN